MNRKLIEDVVVHHGDATQRVAQTNVPQGRKNAPISSASSDFSSGEDRIENNPFFEKGPQNVKPFSVTRARPQVFLWILAIVAVAATAFLVANYFSSATVEITPLTYQGHISSDFVATKELVATPDAGDQLAFQFVNLTEEKSMTVPATIEQRIEKKASGRVIIYNSYSKDAQRLIKNTRLESSDKKIFRIDQSVVVPGAKIVAGKVNQPGAVEVLIYADVAGKEYNIGLGDFTIPGFKGDPRYTKFSARSKADSPIDGGYSGTVKVPTDTDVQKAQSELKEGLKLTAIEKARALIPTGMMFFPGSTVIKFEEAPQDYATGDTAKVVVRATVSIFFFDTTAFMKKIAAASLTDYKGAPVMLPNLNAISFGFLEPVNNVVLKDLTQIRFHISGDPVFVGIIDTQKLQNMLAGKEKKDFAKIIIGEHNVGKAETTIRPMWRTTFPLNPAKITINILP